MQILALADTEERSLKEYWNEHTAARLSDVGLILSAGDLRADYLEFLVTMLNVPLVYVRGNHDGAYEKRPPEGCIDADGRIVEVRCPEKGGMKGFRDGEAGIRTMRILGLGGSMRYKTGAADMYTETEMAMRTVRTGLSLAAGRLRGKEGFDILLTHAPCKNYGDMDDPPHRGFECFGQILERYQPKYHVYGHVHKEYSGAVMAGGNDSFWTKGYRSVIEHPSGTKLINASGYQIIEI